MMDHFRDGLTLNKLNNDRVTKIELVAILDGDYENVDLSATKYVCYQSGFEIEILSDDKLPPADNIQKKILEAVYNVKQARDDLIYGEVLLDDEVVKVEVKIYSMTNTYSQVVCENCLSKLMVWINDVYQDIYYPIVINQ